MKYVKLFFIMLKIGLFTFGGGYAMIALLENEFVSGRKWMNAEEFADMVAVAESTPGPIAINAATYIGYKTGGVAGSAIATLAVCIPSFAIIYAISLFFNAFLEIAWVAAAFRGIQVCVVFLIFTAGVKMLAKIKRTPFNLVIFVATTLCMLLFSIFGIDFSSIFYVLISGAAGLAVYAVKYLRERKKKGKNDDIS